MNTCDKKQIWTTSDCFDQEWPQLIVQNLTFEDGYSAVRQTATSFYGGGAIYAEGGQFKVVNSRFIGNRCFKTGPDLGGAAIRALAQWRNRPVYITSDTFRGGVCSNGGALSSIDVNWDVFNSLMVSNKADRFRSQPGPVRYAGRGQRRGHLHRRRQLQRPHRGHCHPRQQCPRGRRRHLLRGRQQPGHADH